MKEPTKINAKISAGGQPSEEDITALKASGVRKIINLRRAGEANQPLDPAAEGEVAKRAGLEYVHIPVDPKNLDPSSAAAVAKAIEDCGRSGLRSLRRRWPRCDARVARRGKGAREFRGKGLQEVRGDRHAGHRRRLQGLHTHRCR